MEEGSKTGSDWSGASVISLGWITSRILLHEPHHLVKTTRAFVCYMKPNLILTDASFIHRHLLITYWTSGLVLSPGVIKVSELAKAYCRKRIQVSKIHVM